MIKIKIKKGNTVKILSGNDRGKSGEVIKFNVTPIADTPVLTITDRSTDATREVEGLEDQPIRIFQDASNNPIISLSSSDADGSEVVVGAPARPCRARSVL